MPITLNIGLSRKLSKDYNSTGYSISLNAELPADATQDVGRLQAEADRLFELCDQILVDQIAEGDNGPPKHTTDRRGSDRNVHRGGNAHRSSTPRDNVRRLTDAQARAIRNMARRANEDPDQLAGHEFGVDLADLDVKQASELIDLLKDRIESPAGSRR